MSKPATRIDAFTARRLSAFIEKHRHSTGQLPTLQDFEVAGFERSLIDRAVREDLLVQQYINLTNGPMVKGYVLKQPD